MFASRPATKSLMKFCIFGEPSSSRPTTHAPDVESARVLWRQIISVGAIAAPWPQSQRVRHHRKRVCKESDARSLRGVVVN
jgi:hypothetical protein